MLATRPGVLHLGVEDAVDPRVPVRMITSCALLWIQHHNIRVRPRIYSVLIPSSVISGIVDAHLRVSVDTVVHNVNVCTVLVCERVITAVKLFAQDA